MVGYDDAGDAISATAVGYEEAHLQRFLLPSLYVIKKYKTRKKLLKMKKTVMKKYWAMQKLCSLVRNLRYYLRTQQKLFPKDFYTKRT